jgi:Tfp pilus assembly protein PilN
MSQQINLYNALFLKEEKHFSARTMAQALVAIAVGVLGLYGYGLFETRSAEKLAEQYRDQLATQRDQFAKFGSKIAPQAPSKALESDIARLESEIKARQATLQAFSTGELGNTAGFSEFFAAFGRQAMPGVWLTAVQIADSGNDLIVRGRVLRPELMPSYLRALNKEPMMRGRRVTEMKLAAKSPAAPAKSPAIEPERFVEFILTVPMRTTEATQAATGRPQ